MTQVRWLPEDECSETGTLVGFVFDSNANVIYGMVATECIIRKVRYEDLIPVKETSYRAGVPV